MADTKQKLETLLLKLKNTSEMMIDLAYTSLLYNNTEIAEDVLELEDTVDSLHTQFELAVLRSCETGKEKGMLGLIKIGVATENLADAAAQIASVVLRGIAPHPVMKLVLNESEETVKRVKIAPNSVLLEKNLGDLGLEDHISMRIIAVKRESDWRYNPPDSFKLKPDDVIIARGYARGRKIIADLAHGKIREI